MAGRGIAALVPGIALGALLVWLLESVLAGVLYGVSPWDPTAVGLALLLLVVLGATASVVPALRASSVDPVEALREG